MSMTHGKITVFQSKAFRANSSDNHFMSLNQSLLGHTLSMRIENSTGIHPHYNAYSLHTFLEAIRRHVMASRGTQLSVTGTAARNLSNKLTERCNVSLLRLK